MRSAITEKRQRHTLRRQRSADNADIEHSGEEYGERHADNEELTEPICGVTRYMETEKEKHQKQNDDREREHKPHLLCTYRQNKIGPRLGQIILFLHRPQKSFAENPSSIDGDERHVALMRSVGRGSFAALDGYSGKRKKTGHTVRRIGDLPDKQGKPQTEKRSHVPESGAGNEHQHESDRTDNHNRAEIGLKENRQGQERYYNYGDCGSVTECFNPRRNAVEPYADGKNSRKLSEFSRLKIYRPEGDPSLGTLDRIVAEDKQQGQYDTDKQCRRQPPVIPPVAVIEHRDRNRQNQARKNKHALSLHEEERIMIAQGRAYFTRAEKNNQAQRHEQRDNQAQGI